MQWHQAYILHRRPWRETSLWLEAFSRECGKVALLAKGARRGKRKLPLQPFQPLLLRWRKKGELGTLIDADPLDSLVPLHGEALFCGFYLNELLSILLARDDPHPALFDHYRKTLEELSKVRDLETCLRFYELRLLEAIGYAPVLDHEVEYGAYVAEDLCYRYDPETGPIIDGRGWLHGSTLLALLQGKLETSQVRREAKRLLRILIDHQLQGRALRSRQLFSHRARKP